jgi:rare lipoprotein A
MKSKGIWRYSRLARAFFMITIVSLATGCSHMQKQIPGPGWVETGTASWYGEDFHGKPTASGEKYDMYGCSAAHKTIPLGSRVRVINLENGKEIIVPVNDRGPFVGARIIDMSYGAAQRLGMVEEGLAKVRIEVLELPRNYAGGKYTIQLGAFAERDNARKLAIQIESRGYRPNIEEANIHGSPLYRVRLGTFNSIESAQSLGQVLSTSGFNCFVVGL